MYKNGYKDSSWLSLMDSRLREMTHCFFDRSVLVIAIDKVEQSKMAEMLEGIYPDMEKSIVAIQHNPTGQMGDNFAESNQFAYFIYNRIKNIIGMEYRDSEDADTRSFRDNSGNSNLRTDAANCFYPIFVKGDKIVGFGDVSPDEYHPSGRNVPQEDGSIAFPFDISPQTSPKRRWSVRRFGSQMASQTWKCYRRGSFDGYVPAAPGEIWRAN